MMFGLDLETSSPQQICTWLAAAAAGLQLLPVCARLAEVATHPSESEKVRFFIGSMMSLFVEGLPWQLQQLTVLQQLQQQQSSGLEEATAWDSLPTLQWALHTSLCRFIATLSAPNAPLRLPGQKIAPSRWRPLLSSLNYLLIALANSHGLPLWLRASSPPRWQLHSFPDVPQ